MPRSISGAPASAPLAGGATSTPVGLPVPASPGSAPLAERVLEQLFNGTPWVARPSLEAEHRPAGVVESVFARLVREHNADHVHADLEDLIAALAESQRLGPEEAAYRLSNSMLGKALHVLCHLWRNRSVIHVDLARLTRAVQLCGALIEGQQKFMLETCGVLMFHLGELMTCQSVRTVCECLICDHLEPRFRGAIRQRPPGALTGKEVAFGLVSALRASETRLGSVEGAPPRTAADRLLGVVNEKLDQEPGLFDPCGPPLLGLMARHGMHYLARLTAIQRRHPETEAGTYPQLNVARLIQRCIDDVHALEARAADAGADAARSIFGGPLRTAEADYTHWLSRQSPHLQSLIARRVPATRVASAGAGVSAAPCATARGPATPSPVTRTLADFSRLVRRLVEPGREQTSGARARAVEQVDALIDAVQEGKTPLTLAARAQLLLDMDTVYQCLDRANPIHAQTYAVPLASIAVFIAAQQAQLVALDGSPLLGPRIPSSTGLHSWQRTLLMRLCDQA